MGQGEGESTGLMKIPDQQIKPQRQEVEMWDFLRSGEGIKTPRLDAAFAFGQGPVQDAETKRKAEEVAKVLGTKVDDEINSWGKTTAIAMGYLHRKGEFREAFWSGGQTGGADYPSEAEHMQKISDAVFGPLAGDYNHLENKSGNTLANFENTLNVMDKLTSKSDSFGQKREFKKFAFVCSNFHAPRIRILGALYNMYDTTVLSSEKVLEVMVHDPTIDDNTINKAADVLITNRDKSISGRGAILAWINQRTDVLNLGLNRTESADYQSKVGGGLNIADHKGPFTHFEKQTGEEVKDPLLVRARNEDMFTEGLLTMPANWLGFIADIENPQRLEGILKNIREWSPGYLEKLGVTADDSLDQVKDKLRPFKSAPSRQFVSLNWKPYESETNQALGTITDRIREIK